MKGAEPAGDSRPPKGDVARPTADGPSPTVPGEATVPGEESRGTILGKNIYDPDIDVTYAAIFTKTR